MFGSEVGVENFPSAPQSDYLMMRTHIWKVIHPVVIDGQKGNIFACWVIKELGRAPASWVGCQKVLQERTESAAARIYPCIWGGAGCAGRRCRCPVCTIAHVPELQCAQWHHMPSLSTSCGREVMLGQEAGDNKFPQGLLPRAPSSGRWQLLLCGAICILQGL